MGKRRARLITGFYSCPFLLPIDGRPSVAGALAKNWLEKSFPFNHSSLQSRTHTAVHRYLLRDHARRKVSSQHRWPCHPC